MRSNHQNFNDLSKKYGLFLLIAHHPDDGSACDLKGLKIDLVQPKVLSNPAPTLTYSVARIDSTGLASKGLTIPRETITNVNAIEKAKTVRHKKGLIPS